jgi:hypothetical protein
MDFNQRRAARKLRIWNLTRLLVGLPPLLSITDVGGYDWEYVDWNRFGRREQPEPDLYGEDPFDESDYAD